MRTKAIFTIAILLAILIIQGCATAGNDTLRKETEASVNAKIIEGVTTRSEIKSMFGSPINTSYTDSGLEIWKFKLSKVSADATSYIPVVSLFAGSSSGTEKELTILFDENDKVKKYNMSESEIKIRTGLFNQ